MGSSSIPPGDIKFISPFKTEPSAEGSNEENLALPNKVGAGSGGFENRVPSSLGPGDILGGKPDLDFNKDGLLALNSGSQIVALGDLLTRNDGTTPKTAIEVTPQAMIDAVGSKTWLNVFKPDAYVVAANVNVGKVDGLLALLVPSGENFVPSAKDFENSTIFGSTKIAGKSAVFTIKPSDLSQSELGVAIKNEKFFGGKLIVFSNSRVGAETILSVNAGFLLRFTSKSFEATLDLTFSQDKISMLNDNIGGNTIDELPSYIPKQIDEVINPVGDLFKGNDNLGSYRLGEPEPKQTIGAKNGYVGLAWRGGIDSDGHLKKTDNLRLDLSSGDIILKAEEGDHEGKWIKVNITDIPRAFIESILMDKSIVDQDWER